MIKHRILGNNDKITKQEIKNAIEVFCEELFPKQLRKNTFLVVEFMNRNDFLDRELDFTGYGIMYARDHNSKKHKKYSIWINSKYSKKQQLITLFHELVHVLQARTGKLQFNDKSMTRWCSRNIDTYKGEPWEKDPERMEEKLYNKYREKYVGKQRILASRKS